MLTLPLKRGTLRVLLILLLVFICLGMARLQLWRAETRGDRFEKEHAVRSATPIELSAQLRDPAALIDRAATARGLWLPQGTLYLDNKIYRSRAGFHVLTPLRLAGSEVVVLVNRGWIVAPRLRSDLPTVPAPGGEVSVSGLTTKFETQTFELKKTAPQGPIWQHVREMDYRQNTGLDPLPIILLQTGGMDDGLIRDWETATNPASKHYGYAAMWLMFALMAAGYGIFAWRNR